VSNARLIVTAMVVTETARLFVTDAAMAGVDR
jgi:hypothetical protein